MTHAELDLVVCEVECAMERIAIVVEGCKLTELIEGKEYELQSTGVLVLCPEVSALPLERESHPFGCVGEFAGDAHQHHAYGAVRA